MEVKEVWFDMEKVEKKGNTLFHIVSDKFDKPIELKIGYEATELNGINNKIQIQNEVIGDLNKRIGKLQEEKKALERDVKDIHERERLQDGAISKFNEILEEQKKSMKELYKMVADFRESLNTLSGTTIHLQEQTKLIDKKLTKQPRVYSDKTFISGHESVSLGYIDIPNGDYVVVSKFVVGEHNEYVENQDDIIFEKVHVEDGYMPMYQLVGGTAVDTPTATIYRDLVFIPC